MPRRKAAKFSTVSTSRETIDDEDENESNIITTEWIKSTVRNVHTDVNARSRKKTRFAIEDDGFEVSAPSIETHAPDGAQSKYFAAWLASTQDNTDTIDNDFGDNDAPDLAPENDSHPIHEDASDGSSGYSSDDEPSTEHDLASFAAAKESKVSIGISTCLLLLLTHNTG